jgi:predicted ATPase
MTIGASVKWALGYPAQAGDMEHTGLALARKLHHAPSLAHALYFNTESQLLRRDIASVAATAKELLTISHEYSLAQYRAWALIALGWALVHLGEVSEGLTRLREGLAELNKLGTRHWVPRAKTALAEAYLVAGHYDEGLDEVYEAMSSAGELGVGVDLPRLHLLRGKLLLHVPGRQTETADSCFHSAFDIADEQGARGWALRVTVSMARLLAERGERIRAYDLLKPIYAGFTEGFDTPDLEEAKGLLDALES